MSRLLSATPVLIVETIEPLLPFWIERLGFALADQVPGNDGLGFAILVRDGITLMLQSRASIAHDMPPLADGHFRTLLFLKVDDLDPFQSRLIGVPRLFDRRTTFYGSEEIGVLDPAGNPIVFARFRTDDADRPT